jgi:hypothetical protein
MESLFYIIVTLILLSGQIIMGVFLYQWNSGYQKTLSTKNEIYELNEITNRLLTENRIITDEINSLRKDFDLRMRYGEDSSNYYDAIESAREGASRDKLMHQYDLGKNEADLIIHTHQPALKAG